MLLNIHLTKLLNLIIERPTNDWDLLQNPLCRLYNNYMRCVNMHVYLRKLRLYPKIQRTL